MRFGIVGEGSDLLADHNSRTLQLSRPWFLVFDRFDNGPFCQVR